MRIEATAPGKLVLLGEYAVLEGAPALVLAVNRRARATLTRLTGDACEIVSKTLGQIARGHLLPGGGVCWDRQGPAELGWIDVLLKSKLLGSGQAAGFRAELDTDGFYVTHDGQHIKLGLGSSTALITAFASALRTLAEQPKLSMTKLIDLHRAIQDGRGSGIGVAAALRGGLSGYRTGGRRPQSKTLHIPDGLHWCVVFTGKAVSTVAMLAALADWRVHHPRDYARRIRELSRIAADGVEAVVRNNAGAFLESLKLYAQALAQLGSASGVDIASREHRELTEIAAGCGSVYKSCGAGGGDIGITFDTDERHLQEFKRQAGKAGFDVLEMGQDSQGLEVEFNA
ncbi:MAG: mevalonate kinase family protein [Gammaproteobacteria bacterium]